MFVKICGVTEPQDALDAAHLGAHFIGLNFYEKSKRRVDLSEAEEIVCKIREGGATPVAVFVDADAETMVKIADRFGIEILELHGPLSKEEEPKLPSRFQRIYAVSVQEDGSYSRAGLENLSAARDYLLFDAKDPGQGHSFPWNIFLPPQGMRWFLAGGLKPENVAIAVDALSPYGVDVASGVEGKPGKKDREKMKAFIEKTREKKEGYYGSFGGAFVPELLSLPMDELAKSFKSLWSNEDFREAYLFSLQKYAGRPTPLTEVKRFSEAINGPRIFLKREDLLHTGAHKLNNALGQCLLAKAMGKNRVIAETGAGQHGVATATACARLGLDCVVYMGKKDMVRQEPNVFRMRLLGAKVVAVEGGAQTLKDAVNEALRDFAESYETTHYCLGSALGPHPYPEIVAAFQSIIGKEVKEEFLSRFGHNPDLIVACIGGGSNAIGIFSSFLADSNVKLVGVEGGGTGKEAGCHAARFQGGKPGVLHGSYTYLLQDEQGQISPTHSISAGLDYPAIGPHHAQLFEEGRVEYSSARDDEALYAFRLLAKTEGIIPALESAHALAYAVREASKLDKSKMVVINLSGRGDKDLPHLIQNGLLEIKS